MLLPVFFPSITVEVDGDITTITWTNGLATTLLTGTQIASAKFLAAGNKTIMNIDAGDHVFSTNNDMIISALGLSTSTSSAVFEVGYGTTVDSISGWTMLWTGSATTTGAALPRPMFLPKGNYLTLRRISGGGTLRYTGAIIATQTVVADSNLNDDMEGNSP